MSLERYLPDAIRSRYSLKLLVVSLLVVLAVVAVGYVTAEQVSERVTAEQLDSIEANAELEAEAMGQWIDGEKETIQMMSSHRGLDPTSPGTSGETLSAELEQLPDEAAQLAVVERTPERFSEGTDETIVASTDPTIEGEPLEATNIDWNPETGYNFEDTDDVILSWVYLDDEDPSVAIASPLPDGEHTLVAVYRTNVRAEEFTSVIDGTDTVVLGGFTAYVLFDENRSNVITPYKGDRQNTTIGQRILETDPYEQLSGSVITDDSVKGYHSVPQDDVDWIVVKETPRSNALSLTAEVRSDLTVLAGLVLFGFALVGAIVQWGPMRALRRLSDQADSIAEGDLSVDIERNGRIDEVGQVRSAFRNTKEYVETITEQSKALSRREFDADVLEAEVPGPVGEAIETMRTDLEQFIDDLERERERYSTLVEQSSDGIVVVQDGRCVFANDRLAEITGYSRERLSTIRFEELAVPEDRDRLRRWHERCLDGASPPEQRDVEIRTRDGEHRVVELSLSRIDHDDDPAALVNVRDVTERERLERTYRELFENVADGLVIHDPDTGVILDVNKRFCELNGYSRSELVGESIEKVTASPEGYSVAAAIEKIRQAKAEGPQLFEWKNQRKSGETFPVEVHLRVARIRGEDRVLASVRDITDRERREQRLEVFNRVLRHNLRNQLDVIKSHAEFLDRQREDNHPMRILDAAETLERLGNRARSIDHVMSQEQQSAEVDLSVLLPELIEDLDRRNGVSVSLEIPDAAPLVTDRETLEAVFESVLDNAFKYADSAVTVSLEATSNGYRISVEDDGPGIPPIELESIDAGTETDLKHGRGLGLWQLKWGIERLEGDLSFDTSEGTTVRITVPDQRNETD